MGNKNKGGSKNDQNEKNNPYSLKQFIHKNKKENLVLKKILEKMNQSLEKDEQDH